MSSRRMNRSTISCWRAPVHDAAADQARQQGQRDVLPDGQVGDDALALAVLRVEPDPRPDRLLRRGEPDRLPVPVDLAVGDGVGAEQGACRLRAAGPEQPGQADDLAPAQRHRRPVEHRGAAEVAGLQDGRGGRRLGGADVPAPPLGLGQLAAEHGRDQVVAGQLGDRRVGHGAAVAQHRDRVAHRVQLVEPVGDEHDRHALVAQPADHVQQDRHLVLRQRRRRLVHDHQLGVEREGPGDRGHLLGGDRVLDQRAGDVDVHVESGRAAPAPRR